ncbi:MAG: AAA family ATPase [Smithellaceae bacterium]
MKIFVVVGMPASGKNIARVYAEARDIPYFATGDLVRNEVRKRGLESDAVAAAAVSTELRGADGLGVTRLALAAAIASGADILFMEGMRSQPEIDLIRSGAECVVIAFLAPRKLRLQRIISRQRPDDSPQLFDGRDRREIEYGTAIPIVLADEYILNTGTPEEAIGQIDQIIRRSCHS